MKQNILKNRKTLAVLSACLIIAAITMSFQNNVFGPLHKMDTLIETRDTIPEKSNYADDNITIKEYDSLLLNMEKEMLQVKDEISKIDIVKIQAEINESMNKIDFDKTQLNIDKVMQQVDFGKIEKEIRSALKAAESDNVNDEVKNFLRNAKQEIEKNNVEDLKKEMEKARSQIQKAGRK